MGRVTFLQKTGLVLALMLVTLLASGSFALWSVRNPADDLTRDEPGQDGRPGGPGIRTVEQVTIGQYFFPGLAPLDTPVREAFRESPSTDWGNFRGTGGLNRYTGPFPGALPDSMPVEKWRAEAGEGYAAPAIFASRYIF